GSSEYYIAFVPAGYDDPINSSRTYKTVYYYNGDGGDGNPTVVTNQALTGSGTSWSGNFTNPSNSIEVAWGSVVIKVNGVEVARGQSNKTIKGSGVTGTMNHQLTAGSFSITFTTPPAATPTVDYLYSPVFEAGIPMAINNGDILDGNTIVFIIHKTANNTFYGISRHFDDPKTHLESLYRVNPNRRIAAGLSRGGIMTRDLLIQRYSQIAAFIIVAPNSASMTWSNYQDRGIYLIGGQTDTVVTPPNDVFMNGAGSITSYRFHPKVTLLDAVGHTSVLWDTNAYNRSTAPFDWVKWAGLWS